MLKKSLSDSNMLNPQEMTKLQVRQFNETNSYTEEPPISKTAIEKGTKEWDEFKKEWVLKIWKIIVDKQNFINREAFLERIESGYY